jgi:hypothetical protein
MAETPLTGGSHSTVVRVSDTVRRESHPWSASVLTLLQHLERQGFTGAPRALGFDEQGREILTYIEGEVGHGDHFIPDRGGRFDVRLPRYVWRDHVLIHLGGLIRAFHDAAATFPWRDCHWMLERQEPAETMCHNELFPWNTVFRGGVPMAFIDWDTAAPGPRARDLGLAAWRWVPFARDEKCRAMGLPTGTADKARRFRILLKAYGIEPDIRIVRAGTERMRELLDHMSALAAEGSAWEMELVGRGVLDEMAVEIAWTEEHAVALAEFTSR